MKKRFFYNHPILGGLIAMAIVMLICNQQEKVFSHSLISFAF